MHYSVGKVGKVIVARLEDGDPIYQSIEEIAQNENIENATVLIIGGVQNGGVVVGPEPGSQPPKVMVRKFEDPREILGAGMLFRNSDGKVRLHMHAAIGKGDAPIVGCPRQGADCWLVNEVVITEITGIEASRKKDPSTGFELLTIA